MKALEPMTVRSHHPDLRTRLATARGWDLEVDDPIDAQVANAYGQWADRLYLGVAILFLPGAVGDFIVWVTSRSPMSLFGPALMLGLCVAYLDLRRQFRQSNR